MESPRVGALREPVRRALLAQAAEARPSRFLGNDPAQFAHQYEERLDREIVGLLSALLAFGNVRAFLPKIRALLGILGGAPQEFIRNFRRSRDGFRSRVYTGEDLVFLFGNLRRIFEEQSTLEDAFLSWGEPDEVGSRSLAGDGHPAGHRARLSAFAALFYRWGGLGGAQSFPPGYRHLVADPKRGSACKRWNLFLRWMVRPADGVDLGIWSRVDPADLVIPLDVHVGRISGLLGLRRRRTLDWKAAEEITASLRAIDPRDPLRFDFALSHIGISEGCRGRWWDRTCVRCAIRDVCGAGRGRTEGLT